MASDRQPWWQRAVLYQIYVRSFADSNGDGVGDLRGIIDRLDYFQWLGVDALWLSPITVSPDRDWGYDVADYTEVQPVFGTLADFDELVADARGRNLRVVIDLVPNHTSDQHPWFQEARASRNSARRDWYVWRDPKPDGVPPNNWRSAFGGGPAWTLDPETGQMYLHSFLPEQTDLNWWNDDVRDAMDDVMRFWLDRGVAGFRLDVAHAIVKDRELRDGPSERDVLIDIDETHAVQRRWRRVVDRYESARILLGETWVMDLVKLAGFYGSGEDQLHLAFNFPFSFSPLEAEALRGVVETTEELLPERAWPAWTLSNHDMPRFPSRMCNGDARKARAALLALLTLRGTPVLYYGDELAMPQVDIPPDRERDMAGRDGARTPLPWDGDWDDPWLPLGGNVAGVAAQRDDRSSFLTFCREVLALRRAREDLVSGLYASLAAPPGVWAWRRGDGTAVALNLSDEPARTELAGRVLLSTAGREYGSELEPWEGVVLELTQLSSYAEAEGA